MTLDGEPPPPVFAERKDSIFLRSVTVARVAVRFREDASGDAPYMFHCHLLAHEDHGMMGQLTVTATE